MLVLVLVYIRGLVGLVSSFHLTSSLVDLFVQRGLQHDRIKSRTRLDLNVTEQGSIELNWTGLNGYHILRLLSRVVVYERTGNPGTHFTSASTFTSDSTSTPAGRSTTDLSTG